MNYDLYINHRTSSERIMGALSEGLELALASQSRHQRCAYVALNKGPAYIVGVAIKCYDESWYEADIIGFGVEHKYKHKGFGSALMKDVTVWADKNNMKLTLTAMPSGPMPLLGLMMIYEQHGFRATEMLPGHSWIEMERVPRMVERY